uniref:F-box protein n=1 Tax=Anthurium amnicola TaxID=1678845 RepID=A0A1D1YTH3_9ARAE
MEGLPPELCSRIFSRLDHQGLATALQVCRRWKRLACDDALWSRLFTHRWGADRAQFYAPPPRGPKSWKDAYEVQDRCDRIGVGLKMVREGEGYYLVHQGEIQRCLGWRGEKSLGEEEGGGETPRPLEVSEKMLFFLADLETACARARRTRRRT